MADWLDELASQLEQSGSDAIPSDPAAVADFVPGKDSQSASDFFKTFFGDGATNETDAGVPQQDFNAAKDSQAANDQIGITASLPSAKPSMSFLEGVLKNMNVKRTSDGSLDFSDPKTIDTLMKVVLGGGSIVNALMNKGQPQNYKSASQLAAEIKPASWSWTPQQQASANAFFSTPMQGQNHQLMFASQMPNPIVPGRGYADGGSVMGGNAMSQPAVTPFSSVSPSAVAYGMSGPLAAAFSGNPPQMQPLDLGGAAGGNSSGGTSAPQSSQPGAVGTDGQTLYTQTSTPYTYQPGGPASVAGGYQSPLSIPGIVAAAGQPNGVMGGRATQSSAPSAGVDLGKATGNPALNGLTLNDLAAMQADPTKAIGTQWASALVGGSKNPGTGAPLHFAQALFDNALAGQGTNMAQLRMAANRAGRPVPAATQPGSQSQSRVRGYAMGGPVMGAPGMTQPAPTGTSPLGSAFPGSPTNTAPGSGGMTPIQNAPTLNTPIVGGPTMYDPGPSGSGDPLQLSAPPMMYDPGPGGLPSLGGGGPNTQFAPRPGFGGGNPNRPMGGYGRFPGQMGGNQSPMPPVMHDPGPMLTPGFPPKGVYGNPGGPSAPRAFARGGALGHVMASTGGQDDVVPINAAGGEYMFDADTVSALGDGNNAAGAKKLDQFRQNLRAHKRSAPPNKIPPKAKPIASYMGGK